MKPSSFSHQRVSQAKRLQLSVGRFGGVDLTSGSFSMSDHRASDMLNLVRRDGALQKRRGLEQTFQAQAQAYHAYPDDGSSAAKTNGTAIHGMWRFEAEDGEEHVIAHIGKLLFEVSGFDRDELTAEPLSMGTRGGYATPICIELLDEAVDAFVGKRMLWVLGGTRYCRVRFTADDGAIMEAVDESGDIFEPTTTIGITPTGAIDATREKLDSPNLVTEWRKNGLVGGRFPGISGPFREYVLDAPIVMRASSDSEGMRVSINESSAVSGVSQYDGSNSWPEYFSRYLSRRPSPQYQSSAERYFAPDYAIYGKLRVEIKDASSLSRLKGLWLTEGKRTSQIDLVGSDGYFRIFVEWHSYISNQDVVSRVDEFTLDDWIGRFGSGGPFNAYYEGGSDMDEAPSSGSDLLALTLKAEVQNPAYYNGATVTQAGADGVIEVRFVSDYESLGEIGCCLRQMSSAVISDQNGDSMGEIPAHSFIMIDESVKDDLDASEMRYGLATINTVALADGRLIHYATIQASDPSDTNVYGPYRAFGYIASESISVYSSGTDYSMKTSKAILFSDAIPPIEGQSNVEIRFPVYDPDSADLINKCRFGILFGNQNARNRLFVSGNPDHGNKDWHTGAAYKAPGVDEDGDFSYFPDDSYCVYGETDNSVCGYSIVSNDRLLVLKTESDKETTVYFRTPQMVLAASESGNASLGPSNDVLYKEEFAVVKGNNSVAAISHKAIANLNGDAMFVSSTNQVMGLDLQGMVGDSQRYASTRSLWIDGYLRGKDLSSSVLWSDGTMMVLATDDLAFVTDFESVSDGQYEWNPIDLRKATCFLKVGGVLHIADSFGAIRRVTDSFADSDKTFIETGLTVKDDQELVVWTGSIPEKEEGEKLLFQPIEKSQGHLYARVFSIPQYDDDGSEAMKLSSTIGDLASVYLKGIISGFTDPCRIEITDDWKVNLMTSSGGAEYAIVQDLFNTGLYGGQLLIRLDGEYEMSDIDRDAGTFKLLWDDGSVINLADYGDQTGDIAIKGRIVRRKPVRAFLITKPFTMGTMEHVKTVWSWTIANDSGIPSEMEVCQVTNKIPSERMRTLTKLGSGAFGLDLSDLSFLKVDLDKSEGPRMYARKTVLSGVRYLCIGMRNYSDTNMVVGPMAITYTIPFPNYESD